MSTKIEINCQPYNTLPEQVDENQKNIKTIAEAVNEVIDNVETINEELDNLDITYTNATPVPKAIGGIAKDETFGAVPITEMFDKLLYPYVEFSASMSTNASGGVFEIGTNRTVTSVTVNITLGSVGIKSIAIYKDSTLIQTVTEGITSGANVITLTTSSTVASNTTFKAVITDDTDVSKTVTATAFTFVYPYYYGVTTLSSLTASDITALTKDVKTKGTKSYTYTMAQQKAVIAYPSSYGTLSKILDANSFDVTDTFVLSVVEVNQVNYNVYVLSDVATSIMTYSFRY